MEVYNSSDYLITQGEFKGMEGYGRKYLLASEVNGTTVSVDDCDYNEAGADCVVLSDVVQFAARFNTVPYHARPLARNLIDNGIYRFVF